MEETHNAKYAEIGRKLRAIPLERHIASHEWEELVEKLCASDDTGLHDIGIRERGDLKYNRADSSPDKQNV